MADKESSHPIAYRNTTSQEKVYELNTSHPSLLLLQARTLVLQSNQEDQIIVHFMPTRKVDQLQAYLYVCDASTGRSDAVQFNITYNC
jgi:hypothetical protein